MNSLLKMSIWFFLPVKPCFMSFASAQNWFIFIPAAFLISSAANAGFVISVFNRRYESDAEDNRIVYDNFYTAAIGLGSILGPLTGGAVKGMIDARTAAPVLLRLIRSGRFRRIYRYPGALPDFNRRNSLLQFTYFYFRRRFIVETLNFLTFPQNQEYSNHVKA